MDLTERVAAALEASVLPSVIARGGALRVVAVEDGVAILEASGSPGAVGPLVSRIEVLLRAAVPGVAGVRVVAPADTPAPSDDRGDLTERVRGVLDTEVNPTIAAHRGHATLVSVDDGWVRVHLEGGCQGCSLAEVTVRQGVHPCSELGFPTWSAS